MRLEVRNDAQNLSDHRIETLRVEAHRGLLLAGAAIAASDVENTPVGIATSGGGIEHNLSHRMDSSIELYTHDFARRAFERGIRSCGIGPLDQDRLALDVARCWDGSRRLVARRHECGEALVVGQRRFSDGGFLDVNGVERSIRGIVGIEREAHEPVRVTRFIREAMKQSRPRASAVQVEVDGRRLRVPVDDVERAVQIVDEESPRSARLFLQRVDTRELPVVPGGGDGTRRRHGEIVANLQRLSRGARGAESKHHDSCQRPLRVRRCQKLSPTAMTNVGSSSSGLKT